MIRTAYRSTGTSLYKPIAAIILNSQTLDGIAMRLSMRNQKASAFLPIRRRHCHQRSLSLIPINASAPDFIVDRPLHQRSRSISYSPGKRSESVDEILRFLIESSKVFFFLETSADTSSDQPTKPHISEMSSATNAVSSTDDELDNFFCNFSLQEPENQSHSEDYCPLTPKSQMSSHSDLSPPPPPLARPTIIYLDASSAADSELFLPDCF